MDILQILTFIGGLSMFLYGMNVMGAACRSWPEEGWKRYWKS